MEEAPITEGAASDYQLRNSAPYQSRHLPPRTFALLSHRRIHRDQLSTVFTAPSGLLAGAMVFAQLIEDVLAIVCEFLTDVPDILSFALICSSLHPVAIKRLLSMRPIHLTGRQSIPKFHFFLFTDVCARAPHVRALDLDTRRRRRKSMNQPSDAPRLVEILTSCPRLDRIVVSFDNRSSPGLIDEPRVINTIATIPSLRSLSVYGSTTDAFNFLREVHAPLRTLEIHCRDQPDGYWYPAALENTLKRPRLASTLEDLRLSSFIVDPKAIKMLCNVVTPSTFGMAQYPAVRSLSIRSFKGEPILDDLQHLFPALDGTLSLHRLSESFDENSYARIRAANQRAQENNPSRAWRKLDRLGVHDAPVLYVLGLLCPIRLVVLEYPNAHTKLHYAREALRENPVPKLKLSLLLNRPLPAPDDFLSEELAHALTHLMVCLVYSNNDFSSAIVNPGAFTRVQWDDLLVRSSILAS